MTELAAVLIAAIAAAPPVNAQVEVPTDLYVGQRRMSGDNIIFCLWQGTPTAGLDRTVGHAIADRLLLDASFVDLDPAPIGNDFDFEQVLFIAMTDRCDAVMGINLAWEPVPQWLTISEPYYSAPYLLAVTNPAYTALTDIPRGGPIGSERFTEADLQLLSYLNVLPARQRWVRYPYDSRERMVADLLSGEIAAALILGPALYRATDGDPAALGIHIADPGVLSVPGLDFGIALRSEEIFIRELVDAAIASLRADGTLAGLIAAASLPPSLP